MNGRGAVPVFEILNAIAELEVPWVWSRKVNANGETLRTGVPVALPVRMTFCCMVVPPRLPS